MIPAFLLNWVLRAGVPEKMAKAVAFVVMVAVLMLILLTGKCAYDKSIIDADRAESNARQAQADRKADAKAAEQRRADDSRLVQEAGELKETQNAPDPLERRRAFHRCLRLQQDARAAGLEPPSCN